MSNTLTISAFAENLFRARDIVAREMSGAVTSVIVNSEADGVSINGTVTSLTAPQPTINSSYTPAMTIPAGDDQTIAADTIAVDQVANARIPMSGEAWKKLTNTAGGQNTLDNMFAQALRGIVNTIEGYLCGVIYKGASRAVGTPGTTPFASNFNTINSLRQILEDNGAPLTDGQLSLIINSAAGVNLRNLSTLQQVNTSGDTTLLRRGTLLDLSGFMLKGSAGIASHTKGAGASGLLNGAAAIGATTLVYDTLTVNTTGIKAGDIITHASDSTNKYVVKTTTTATSGNLVINGPGLKIAGADNDALTVGNSYTANVALHRNAVELALRPPAMPIGGDAAVDRMTLFDAPSGLTFEVALYAGYGMNMFDITVFYGAKVWKPEFVATLLG